jgi:hypothetical protein
MPRKLPERVALSPRARVWAGTVVAAAVGAAVIVTGAGGVERRPVHPDHGAAHAVDDTTGVILLGGEQRRTSVHFGHHLGRGAVQQDDLAHLVRAEPRARAVPPKIVGLTVSPAVPVVGQRTTFSAEVTGATPTRWAWTVTRAGRVEVSSASAVFDHTFAVGGRYRVRLAVTAAGRTARRTTTITVAEPNIHCGDTISVDLVANVDLNCPGDGLVVGADDVTLDLGGHTITGTGTGVGLTVANQSNVTVRNGTIADFQTGSAPPDQSGVVANNAQNVTFSDVTVQNSSVAVLSSNDAVVTGATINGPFDANFSERVSLTDNQFGGAVVRFANGSQHTVTDNTFTGGDLVFLESAASQTRNNTFSGGRVVVGIVAFGHTIADNVFTGVNSGVRMADATSTATVTGNRFDGSLVGVRATLPGAPGATVVSGNTFVNTGAAGVLLDSTGASGTLEISDNTVTGSGHQSGGMTDRAGNPVDDGIHVNAPVGSAVTIAANHTENSADFGIEAVPGSVIDGGGNTSTGDPHGCLGVTCG